MKTLYETLGYAAEDAAKVANEKDDLIELTGEEFSKAVVASYEYKSSIIRRIREDKLPAAVECKLLDHAWGKVTEKVEHSGSLEVTKIERVIIDSLSESTEIDSNKVH